MARRYNIKVSQEAHAKLQELASAPKYKGRGIVGALDMLVLGRFSTNGCGRPKGSKTKKKAS